MEYLMLLVSNFFPIFSIFQLTQTWPEELVGSTRVNLWGLKFSWVRYDDPISFQVGYEYGRSPVGSTSD